MKNSTREIVEKIMADIQSLSATDAPICGEDLIGDAIERAIREERERCAKIADASHRRNLADAMKAATDDDRLIWDSAQAAAAAIAEEIRKPI